MIKTVINFIAFQVGWFACVLGAANGMPWIGLAVCLPIFVLHLSIAERPGAEINLIAIAVAIGLLLDSFLVLTGWLGYQNGILLAGMAPYWILLMWALFASTLNVSMRWLRGKYAMAAIFGAVGGPLSYLAGARLGAVEFIQAQPALITLALGWAITMPVLMRLAQHFDGISGPQALGMLEKADA